jgi:hypothetical protein|tara:strand:- start:897 stop:1115 length:219 start_codon:yes stop_codon:yes gene_type:complete
LQGEDFYLSFSSPFYVFYEEKKMTYSEFLNMLSEKNIEFIYDGHEPMHTSDTKEEDKIDECFFRVYLKPDKE